MCPGTCCNSTAMPPSSLGPLGRSADLLALLYEVMQGPPMRNGWQMLAAGTGELLGDGAEHRLLVALTSPNCMAHLLPFSCESAGIIHLPAVASMGLVLVCEKKWFYRGMLQPLLLTMLLLPQRSNPHKATSMETWPIPIHACSRTQAYKASQRVWMQSDYQCMHQRPKLLLCVLQEVVGGSQFNAACRAFHETKLQTYTSMPLLMPLACSRVACVLALLRLIAVTNMRISCLTHLGPS